MTLPLRHYHECSSDLERRLESIALTYVKQRAAGEKPDINFHQAARAMGMDNETEIARIRRRATQRYLVIKRLGGRCIFEEADRIASLA